MVTGRDYMNTAPQMVLALLHQLVDELGVVPSDISVGDPLCLFPNEYYDPCFAEFPDVHYLDYFGGNAEHPRTGVPLSDVPVYWSCHPVDVAQDYVPTCFTEATYLINFANFKSHSNAGVTLSAKNHYGSLVRIPLDDSYYNLHLCLANVAPDYGSYRALVDLQGHAHLGGKTLLYLIDGLYSGVHPDDLEPHRWDFSPFDGDWTSSLFASQDPIALDSVCFDFMQEEGDPRLYPQQPGADDYLHEGVLANDPLSETFYDPDHEGDVQRLQSLGVHEHWNNPVDMQYSRNLGTGEGIELIRIDSPSAVEGLAPSEVRGLRGYPNPSHHQTTFQFDLARAQHVKVAVYATDGRLVTGLVDGILGAGDHRVIWNGTDDRGRTVPTATYFIRGETAGDVLNERTILVR